MAGWWSRNFHIRVPAKILSYASLPEQDDSKAVPATKLADTPQKPEDRLNWLRRMARALQQQMTDALSRGEHFVAESIRCTLSPIHKELLERESQLSSAKRDGEQLTPGQRKRQSKLAADLMTDMRRNREYFASRIIRRLLFAFGRADTLKLLSDAGQAAAKESEFPCMTAELEYARAAAGVLEGWLQSCEGLFGQLLIALQTVRPEQWENCGDLFSVIPPHLVKIFYDRITNDSNDARDVTNLPADTDLG